MNNKQKRRNCLQSSFNFGHRTPEFSGQFIFGTLRYKQGAQSNADGSTQIDNSKINAKKGGGITDIALGTLKSMVK